MKGPWFMANDSERSQWISLGGDKPKLPDGVTYTFRTTFQLADATHQAVLRGGFMADNHVAAIRLNGRSLVVPEHGYESPFNQFHLFKANTGFVAGTNVMEFDVTNGLPEGAAGDASVSSMALMVELEGIQFRSRVPAVLPNDKQPRSGKEGH